MLKAMSLHDLTVHAAAAELRKTRAYAERALAQLRDEELIPQLHPEQCSIAAYVRHMAGNMRSRHRSPEASQRATRRFRRAAVATPGACRPGRGRARRHPRRDA